MYKKQTLKKLNPFGEDNPVFHIPPKPEIKLTEYEKKGLAEPGKEYTLLSVRRLQVRVKRYFGKDFKESKTYIRNTDFYKCEWNMDFVFIHISAIESFERKKITVKGQWINFFKDMRQNDYSGFYNRMF